MLATVWPALPLGALPLLKRFLLFALLLVYADCAGAAALDAVADPDAPVGVDDVCCLPCGAAEPAAAPLRAPPGPPWRPRPPGAAP